MTLDSSSGYPNGFLGQQSIMTKHQVVSFLLEVINNKSGYQTAVKIEAIKALTALGYWNADKESVQRNS
jgi:hypothetical protein